LGVTVPVATGLALGLRARQRDPFVVCHCGDAGWISGQALNGFNAATLQGAPIAFVMHRNGIQLSGTTAKIMNRDPRPIVSSLGVRILEIQSLHERAKLFEAYREAYQLAQEGKPSLIFPVGYRSSRQALITVQTFERHGIVEETGAAA
jgi:transketolase N-terminal domain/subunit